ncbi:MAG TPA: hypothetical protein VD995_10220 [Azospirillum sp.]|nr:hypothetical protein [Azospirillum sp.]
MAHTVTVTYDDTALPYGTPPMTANITAAVDSLVKHYNTSASIDVLVKVEDLGETTLATGAADASVYMRTYVQGAEMLLKNAASTPFASLLKQAQGASYPVYQSGAAYEIVTGSDPNGDAPDITLSISQTALTTGNLFWFDPTPQDPTPAYTPLVPADQYDFYDVVRHEMGHALGITSVRDLVYGVPAGGIMTTFDRWMSFIGAQPTPLPYFAGPSTLAVYGTPMPLVDGDYTHYPSGTGLRDGLFSNAVELGTRGSFTALDFALLRDVGLIDAASLVTGTEGNDSLAGTPLDDVISGAGGNDTLLGGGGKDVLAGGSGNDSLSGDAVGQSADDVLVGDGGHDRLDGGGGNDWIDGGEGNDTILGTTGADTLNGGSGADSIYGDFLADRTNTMNTGLTTAATHVDVIDAGAGDDWINGGAGADLISGGTGADTFAFADPSESTPSVRDVIADYRGDLKEVFAADGTRTIEFLSVGGAKAVLIPGQDIVDFRGATAHTQRDRIDLTEMDADSLAVGKQAFTFVDQAAFTAAGQVRWSVEGASIIVEGNVNTDLTADFAVELRGIASTYTMTAADFIFGLDSARAAGPVIGAPVIGVKAGGAAAPEGIALDLASRMASDGRGAAVAVPYAPNAVGTFHGDRMTGDTAGNMLWGDDGEDTVYGDAGNDTLSGGYGQDQLSGGIGGDLLYGNADSDRLSGNRGNDTAFGGSGNDILYGNADSDALYGNTGRDTLYGGSGDDVLFGGLEADLLFGGVGNDTLHGNRGNDTLWGGEGADRFVIGSGGGADVIADFSASGGDRIAITAGMTWQLGQDASGSVVLTLASGHTVAVLGVSSAQFNAGWIVPA